MSWWKPDPVEIDLSKYGTPEFNKGWDKIQQRRSGYWTYEDHIREISEGIQAEVEKNMLPGREMLQSGNYSGFAREMSKLGYLPDQDVVNMVMLHRIKNGEYDESRT